MLSVDDYHLKDDVDHGFSSMPSTPKEASASILPVESSNVEVISQLANLEGGFQCLLDKVKHDVQTAKDVTSFLKKRAAIEEEYGKQMIKLSQSMTELHDKNNPRPSSYTLVWTAFLKVHEQIGDQRIKFSSDIAEVADDVQIMSKDTEKSRKQVKEIGVRHEKNRQDIEAALDKSKQRYDMLSEEWERGILARSNTDNEHTPKMALFKSNRIPTQKQVDESCSKASQSQSSYKSQLSATNAARQEYFNSQLPSDILTLKGVSDECCTAIRYQLARYSYVFEEALTKDGIALDNDDGSGLRSLTEKIDFRADIADVVNFYRQKSVPMLRKDDIPFKEYPMSITALNVLKPNPVFGVHLTKLMERDNNPVPLIVTKCVEAIEASGLKSDGLYRVSGTESRIQELKRDFDRNQQDVNLLSAENLADVNNITSLLKLWLRELPDPLFTQESYEAFIKAAQIESDRMRVLGLHTIINGLPDANYATLKYVMGHLNRVQQHQQENRMTAANLATIFGITLMGEDQSSDRTVNSLEQSEKILKGAHWSVKVAQTILENYRLIFVFDEEETAALGAGLKN